MRTTLEERELKIDESYFDEFRSNTIGQNEFITTPYGEKKLVYADWIASGRLYAPIEQKLANVIGPFMANTHTESSTTGRMMTEAYSHARETIKKHVGAHPSDILISSGSGMTGVINKLQRILGFRVHEKHDCNIRPKNREELPIVFVTHMEHHSNQTSWEECLVEVKVIPADQEGLPDLVAFKSMLEQYKDRPLKIAAVTSCSNVTGIMTPYHDMAKLVHEYDGLCFVDFAASAPYVDICMRPEEKGAHLDAIFFSPHKFLGGPGSSGILVFCPKLYTNKIPDNPGGGTVDWTNPWGEYKYLDNAEAREDGGTPAILQTIRVSLCIKLKEKITVEAIEKREKQIIDKVWSELLPISNINILADKHKKRIGAISFYIDDLHYNLAVRMLNDRYGIQVRGGCHCAGTYGHFLLDVDRSTSKSITDLITAGDLTQKPGWVRLSIHPIMADKDIDFIINAIKEIAENHQEWQKDYRYVRAHNDFNHINEQAINHIEDWFSL